MMNKEEIIAALKEKPHYIDGIPGYLCSVCTIVKKTDDIVWKSGEGAIPVCKECADKEYKYD